MCVNVCKHKFTCTNAGEQGRYLRFQEGALRDDTKNGCVADYDPHGERLMSSQVKQTLRRCTFRITDTGFRIP